MPMSERLRSRRGPSRLAHDRDLRSSQSKQGSGTTSGAFRVKE